MQRMTGLDACFLYMETRSVSMHTVTVLVFDVSAAPDGCSIEQVRRFIARRIHRVPRMRRRIMAVPLGLHHPVWIEDPAFELARHVGGVRLAAPGDRRQLEVLVAQLLSTPMDRERPLWELTVVEGLEGGQVAIVCKVHHAMLDGGGIAEVVQQWLASEEVETAVDVWAPEPVPGVLRLMADAVRDRVRVTR